jgi:hypothetical protein
LDNDKFIVTSAYGKVVIYRFYPDNMEIKEIAFASMLQAQKKPFFVDVINNSSLKQLFDFVLGVNYDHNFPID